MTTGARRDQIRGFELRAGEVGTDELADGAVTPVKFDSSVYGTGTTTIDPDDATSHGVSTAVSRTDHQHQATAAAPVSLTETATNSEGSAATWARSDHAHATDNLPWGLIAKFESTSSTGSVSVDTVTDMALSNTAVRSGHVYALHFHGNVLIGAGAGQWSIFVRVNGTNVGRFAEGLTAGSRDVDGTVYWTAGATQATDDFDILLDETVDGSTAVIQAGATAPRFFTITDLGAP